MKWNFVFSGLAPLPNLPPWGKEQHLSPLEEIRKGALIVKEN
jgi:hypothetical protein